MSSLPTPTPQQLAWQKMRLGIFIHFGINTFFGAQWSDGTLPASAFNPTRLDTDQWASTTAELGARYVVLTAKHHDGFCLWPTKTTRYGVSSSPWRGGTGDLVAEFAQACRAHSLGVGLYLSPWDRNAPCYPDAAAYDDFYCQQLTELCTKYGELTEIWFDGAGSAGREYDWPRIMSIIAQHQPTAMVFNMGTPTIRWVGNENGMASDPVDYVVTKRELNNYDDALLTDSTARYLPPECDVSIRRGWFWAEDDEPKSLDHLLGIYYHSIGMGANLLLNVAPDISGRIPPEDLQRLNEWRTELSARFSNPVPAQLRQIAAGRWIATLPPGTRCDHIALEEDYALGQRVRSHRVLIGDEVVASGLTVGEHRIHAFPSRVTDTVLVELTGPQPMLSRVAVFDTGGKPTADIGYLAPTQAPKAAGKATS